MWTTGEPRRLFFCDLHTYVTSAAADGAAEGERSRNKTASSKAEKKGAIKDPRGPEEQRGQNRIFFYSINNCV